MKSSVGNNRKTHPLFYIASGVIIIAGIKIAAPILNPLLMAIFFSIIIMHPIKWLKNKGVNGILSIIIVSLGLLLIFFGIGSAVAKSLLQFTNNISVYKSQLSSITSSSITLLNGYGIDVSANSLTDGLQTNNVFNFVSKFITGVGGLFGQIILLMLVAAFIIGESNTFPTKLKVILKNPTVSLDNITLISLNIRYYLGIKTITGLIGGISVTIVLYIMGVQYAIIWGILVLLMRFIPSIGSIMASIPIALFVLIQSGLTGVLYFGIAYALINFIIGQIVEPKFLAKGMNLSTLVVFLSLVFWGWTLGDIGMLLAIPITMAIKISLETREETKWISILLGSQKSAEEALSQKHKINDN